jgi:hypothetical protein
MIKPFVMYNSVPNLIEPTTLTVDFEKLADNINGINEAVGHDPLSCLTATGRKSSISLTHPKVIPQKMIDRYGEFRSKFIGPITDGEYILKTNYNISTSDFTEMHQMVRYSYVKTVMDQIQTYHSSRFGKGTVRWIQSASLGPGGGFCLHKDPHCELRYHVVLQTNNYCYTMVLDNDEIKVVHMPADGRVWLLDTNVLHNAVNYTNDEENPLSVRTHLIFTVYDN